MNDSIYLYACRYGHSRSTGAPLHIVTMTMNAWPNITGSVRSQIIRETHEARFCLEDWERLREFAKKYNKEKQNVR